MEKETIEILGVDVIDDPHAPMRSELERDGLFELANNIKQNGLINPITVRPVGNRYEVVAGHRRLSACKIAGLVRVSCVVRTLDDTRVFEIMAAENLERQDVDPVDEATFITKFMQNTNKSVEEVAASLKRSVSYVKSRLSVGEMSDYTKQYLKEGKLKLGVALALQEITDDATRKVWTELAVRDGASVAQAEYWVYDWKRQQLPGGTPSDLPPGDFVAGAPQVIMFECAIDGKKYDTRLCKTLIIAEANLPYFHAFVSEFRKPTE